MSVTASREASPTRAPIYQNGHHNHHLHNGNQNNSSGLNNGHYTNGDGGTGSGHMTEQSDDEYIDTIDDEDDDGDADTLSSFRSTVNTFQAHTSRSKLRNKGAPGSGGVGPVMPTATAVGELNALEVDLRFHNVLIQMNATVERMSVDLKQVSGQVVVLERALNDLRQQSLGGAVNRVSGGLGQLVGRLWRV